jgi:hypothetical protein
MMMADEQLISLMLEEVQTSETLVNLNQSARRSNPEDSHFHTHRRENLNSYMIMYLVQL